MRSTGDLRHAWPAASSASLAIVRRGEWEVFRTLRARAGATGTEVMWDRRRGERRHAREGAVPERRRADRRRPPPRTWRSLGFALMPHRPDGVPPPQGVALTLLFPRPEATPGPTPSSPPELPAARLLSPSQARRRVAIVAAAAGLLVVAGFLVSARGPAPPGDTVVPVEAPRVPWLPGYLHEVDAQIRARWIERADEAGTGARVVVRLRIGRDGQLQAARVAESSGSTGRDHAGLAAVVGASPFPPLPTGTGEHGLTLEATLPPAGGAATTRAP
jgi:TonB family protein